MTTPTPSRSSKTKRRKHTKEFKQEAVLLARRDDVGFARAAKDLGIHKSLLRLWAKAQATEGADAFRGHGKKAALEAEIARLQRENRTLQMERDILDAAWQGPYSQGGANPPQVTARHGPDIQPWRYIGKSALC